MSKMYEKLVKCVESVREKTDFKPEVANVYDEIAKTYEKETGVKLLVETAASGNYDSSTPRRGAGPSKRY